MREMMTSGECIEQESHEAVERALRTGETKHLSREELERYLQLVHRLKEEEALQAGSAALLWKIFVGTCPQTTSQVAQMVVTGTVTAAAGHYLAGKGVGTAVAASPAVAGTLALCGLNLAANEPEAAVELAGRGMRKLFSAGWIIADAVRPWKWGRWKKNRQEIQNNEAEKLAQLLRDDVDQALQQMDLVEQEAQMSQQLTDEEKGNFRALTNALKMELRMEKENV